MVSLRTSQKNLADFGRCPVIAHPFVLKKEMSTITKSTVIAFE
jgi:hypothetical protein